jgi:hypothetical protein
MVLEAPFLGATARHPWPVFRSKFFIHVTIRSNYIQRNKWSIFVIPIAAGSCPVIVALWQ